jgi:hypothetical protein
VFCLSDPLDERGYFSEGIVNRFYWKRAPKGDLESLDALKNLRVNVSTDWAPGSSGAAVLDQCGNAIGHVSTISPLSEGAHQPAPPFQRRHADHSARSRAGARLTGAGQNNKCGSRESDGAQRRIRAGKAGTVISGKSRNPEFKSQVNSNDQAPEFKG